MGQYKGKVLTIVDVVNKPTALFNFKYVEAYYEPYLNPTGTFYYTKDMIDVYFKFGR